VIDIVDVAKLEVIGRIRPGRARDFVIDEKRRRIYVSNEEGSVALHHRHGPAITRARVPTGAEPEGVFLSEDGSNVYVTSEVETSAHGRRQGAMCCRTSCGTRPRRFAATPDRKELWVTPSSRAESNIIDRTKFEVAGKIEFCRPDAQDRCHAGRPHHDQGRSTPSHARARPHVAVVDVPTRKIQA